MRVLFLAFGLFAFSPAFAYVLIQGNSTDGSTCVVGTTSYSCSSTGVLCGSENPGNSMSCGTQPTVTPANVGGYTKCAFCSGGLIQYGNVVKGR